MTIRLLACMLLVLVSGASAAIAAVDPGYRLERTDGTWTGTVSLDSVRGSHLYFSEDGRAESIAIAEVRSIRRGRRSHVIGGLVGLVGGALAGTGLGASVYLLTGPGDHGNWAPGLYAAGTFVASTIIGTIWGANEGLPTFPVDTLSLEGLDDAQREAALARFVLDERLRDGER